MYEKDRLETASRTEIRYYEYHMIVLQSKPRLPIIIMMSNFKEDT
jgi:hypothetical protein